MLYICKYVHIIKKQKKNKKKKTVTCFLGKFISSGTELSPSLSIFPFSNRLWKERKKGGATSVDSRLTGELVANLDLSGFSDPRSNGPVLFCFVMSSQKSLAAYPPTKR